MAKQSNQKLKLLYLLKILIENTDENTGLTITQISNELAKYNVKYMRVFPNWRDFQPIANVFKYAGEFRETRFEYSKMEL